MKLHEVKVHPAVPWMEKTEQLAWKIAEVAADNAPLDPKAVDMAINRVIDIAGVAIAAINRDAVVNTRTMALAHPRKPGATLFGLPNDVTAECEWVTLANAAAVRELDWHDTGFGADACHPSENIPAMIAVAQQCGRSGDDLLQAILTAYEIHISLANGLRYRPNKMDHQALIGPATAAGIGTMLGLDVETIYQAVNYAAHICLATRQGRKGIPSSWKAYAPGHFSKLGVESVDRAMRGETSPSPVFEGDFALLATVLGGPKEICHVPLPEKGEAKVSILQTYTKEYSVSSHGQALVDLAINISKKIDNLEDIESIVLHVCEESHVITGCGALDAEHLYDPKAQKRFLDHSAMYQFAVALEDGCWNNVANYAPERAQRPSTVRLWKKISTVLDEEWDRRYLEPAAIDKDHGGKAVVTFKDGSQLIDELAVANAHPRGAQPFGRQQYIKKFDGLIEGMVAREERDRYLGLVERLAELSTAEVRALNILAIAGKLKGASRDKRGIF